MNKGMGLVSYYDDESSDEENIQSKQLDPSHSKQLKINTSSEVEKQKVADPPQAVIEANKNIKEDIKAVNEPLIPPPSAVKIVQSNALDRSSLLKNLLIPKAIDGIDNWGILPEPNTACDSERQEKIEHFLSLRKSGHCLNEHLQRNKSFRNPRIYAKLVEFVDIDEIGSNFPKDQFDPKGFPESSYMDGILETQRQIAEEKAQRAAQGRSQLAFVPSSTSSSTPPSISSPSISIPKQNTTASSPSVNTSIDKASKLAAAMANAAKIASRIAKPAHSQPTPSVSSTTNTSSPTVRYTSSTSSHTKRSSHGKWDKSDHKRRHR
ncbi:HCNGP-like protein-domain-containing protein [Cunninghamella echinulata]|nr:HCNGP-like protein-domain-containing protein [Cunninghamella echinulata]